MWDFFFLLVSKYVFAHTGKICFAITKGHAFNKSPNYGFLLSSSFDEVFYKFETTGGSRVTGTYPSLSMLFMPGPENFSLSSQEAWSPVRGKVGEESTKNLMKEITKKSPSHFISVIGGWDVDLCHASLQDTTTEEMKFVCPFNRYRMAL